jgi:hypothetical protein
LWVQFTHMILSQSSIQAEVNQECLGQTEVTGSGFVGSLFKRPVTLGPLGGRFFYQH